jgi:hypothetical protein
MARPSEVSIRHYIMSTLQTDDVAVQGGVIPGAGPNKVTEPDTTVFKGKNAAGCGETEGVSSISTLSISIVWGLLIGMRLSGWPKPDCSRYDASDGPIW